MKADLMKAPDSPQHPFKSRSFLHSLGYALHGLRAIVATERNFRAHLLMTVLVTLAGAYLGLGLSEWAIVVVCMSLMMVIEALNTALEYLVDMLTGDTFSERAKMVKDISAGACLIAAMGVATAGLLVFTPHVLPRFQAIIRAFSV